MVRQTAGPVVTGVARAARAGCGQRSLSLKYVLAVIALLGMAACANLPATPEQESYATIAWKQEQARRQQLLASWPKS